MKTIRQLLEELPEPYRTLAIANAEKHTPFSVLDHIAPVQTVAGAVESAFIWNVSREGSEYWTVLYASLLKLPRPVTISPEQKQELLLSSYRSILEICNRLTTGNLPHNVAQIKAISVQGLKILQGEL